MPTSDNKLVEPKGYLTMIADYFHSLRPLWEGKQNATTHGSAIVDDIANQLQTLGNLSLAEGVTHIPTLRTFFDQREEVSPRYALTQPIDTRAGEKEKTIFDVDEWLDTSAYSVAKSTELAYVHFMLTHFRKPGWEKAAHNRFMQCFRLFVDYEEQTWRVTGASRFGDVWLTANLTDVEPQPYYDRRVTLDFSKLSNWRGMPSDVLEPDEPWRPVAFNPNRPKQSLSGTHHKTSGRHYKHVADIVAVRADNDTLLAGMALKPNLPDGICPPGTKLYVRTK